MKKALLIDFDGTICFDYFWRNYPDLKIKEQIDDYLFRKNKDLVSKWMTGKLTSEDVNQHLSESLNISYPALWKVFVEDCKSMFVDQTTLNKINSLRRSYTCTLVTDNADCFDRFTSPALGLAGVFDRIVNSFNYRMSKAENHNALFNQVCEEIGVSIKDAILIDNSVANCNNFAALGGTSYLVTNNNTINTILDSIADSGVKTG